MISDIEINECKHFHPKCVHKRDSLCVCVFLNQFNIKQLNFRLEK